MKKYLLLTILCLPAILICDIHIADSMERFEIITTQELADLLEKRDRNEISFSLVNTLDELIFKHQSIPGSINIPWSQAGKLAKQKLGPDPEKLIVTYCMGYR